MASCYVKTFIPLMTLHEYSQFKVADCALFPTDINKPAVTYPVKPQGNANFEHWYIPPILRFSVVWWNALAVEIIRSFYFSTLF